MKKIYIDITQLYNWRGKVTGIQRVMDEISRRFITDDHFSPIFIVWQKNTASFYEVNFKDTPQEMERRGVAAKPANAPALTPRSHKAKKLLSKIYYRVPLSRTAYNLYSSMNGRMNRIATPGKTVEIENNALLFMPHGGVWESETYISTILNLKKNHKVKLITILYDTVPVLTPQFAVEAITVVFGNYMKQVLPKADLVLTISKNTANDAQKWLGSIGGDAIENIKVFRLGDEVGEQNPVKVEVPKKYILCVGTIEVRKNHAALYYAYKLAIQEGKTVPPIVVVGRVGWMAGDIYTLITSDPETKDKFIFLHNASDDELAWLYQNALFSVYPSFYEGWGLPIAESLLRGTPALASETSSMPEVGGNLVGYFSPFSPEQIKDKINSYYNDPALLKTIKERIKKEYKTTTWDMSYAQVAKEIKKV